MIFELFMSFSILACTAENTMTWIVSLDKGRY